MLCESTHPGMKILSDKYEFFVLVEERNLWSVSYGKCMRDWSLLYETWTLNVFVKETVEVSYIRWRLS